MFAIGRFALPLVISSLLLSLTAWGQVSSPADSSGVLFRGRRFGYVPAHEKVALRQPGPIHSGVSESVAPKPTLLAAEFVHEQATQIVSEPALTEEFVTTGIDGVVAPPEFMGTAAAVRDFCCGPLWFAQAEYLQWSTQGMMVPVLATSGSAADPLPGALGQPGTQVRFGGDELNDDSRSGGRFTFGKWFDDCQSCGLELTYITLESEETTFAASNNDFAVLARPFFNTVTSAQDSRFIAAPGIVSGSLNITAETEFDSFEVLYRRVVFDAPGARVHWLLGYRFAELQDRIAFSESTLSLAGATAGTRFDLSERFDSRSSFHGAEFGFAVQSDLAPCWSWEATAKFALGGTTYQTGVAGQTTTTDNLGNAATVQSGLLALGTNSGGFEWDEFGALTEVAISLRRKYQCGLTAIVGYSFLYWNDVAWAGEQIDTIINSSQVPPGNLVGESRPRFLGRTSDFWAQGLRLGLEYSY